MPIRNVTSSSNPDIRRLKALRDRRETRHAERLFVVEGPRFVRDAAQLCPPVQIVLSESAFPDWHVNVPVDSDVMLIPDLLFATVSSTQTPQGVLGVFPIIDRDPVRQTAALTLVADGIQDPGNLGSMIRSAAANGASQVLCSSLTVDPYNPKVVRAAAAAHFLVPVRTSSELANELEGTSIYLAEGEDGVPIDDVDWTLPSSIVIGSEARGPGSAARRLPATSVTIPMTNLVESLNAGVAASIILYEAFRQRRRRP